MFFKAHPFIFERAKELRNNPTHAEEILWYYLKQRPLGYKFRRQHPISIYIVDFYCHQLKLVIEADGDIHSEEIVREHDAERQAILEAVGMGFLRFANAEIENNIESVIFVIEKYISDHDLKTSTM